MIVATSSSDTIISYKQKWQYITKQNSDQSYFDDAEKYALYFMMFDNVVFNSNKFKINDHNLFKVNNIIISSIKVTPVSNFSNLFEWNEMCSNIEISFQSCPEAAGQCQGENGTCDNCSLCTSYVTLPMFCSGSLSGGSSSGGGITGSTGTNIPGSGGGGGDGWSTMMMDNFTLFDIQLFESLGLSHEEFAWIFTPQQIEFNTMKTRDYLNENNGSVAAKELAKLHIQLMKNDQDYLDFVNEHHNDNIQNVYYAYQTEVVNEVTNPCLLSVISDIGISGLKSTLLNLYQDQTFNPNSACKIIFKQSISVIGNNGEQVYAKTDPIVDLPNGKKQVTITLNKSLLNSSVSKEYIGAVIVHEIVHSLFLIKASSLTQEEQHFKILDGYAIGIGMSLKELFPNISDVDATALALEGIDEVTFPGGNMSTAMNNIAETKYGMGLNYAKNQANKYKTPTSGLGTYC
jgi:hypothetical protein